MEKYILPISYELQYREMITYFFFSAKINVWSYIQKQSPEYTIKKGVLKNFSKFTEKHLYLSLFFNKVAGPKTVLIKWLWHRCFRWILQNF